MIPLEGTEKWLETEPEALSSDPGMAGLMVRIGMAVNALTVNLDLAQVASRQEAQAVRIAHPSC